MGLSLKISTYAKLSFDNFKTMPSFTLRSVSSSCEVDLAFRVMSDTVTLPSSALKRKSLKVYYLNCLWIQVYVYCNDFCDQ